MYHRHAIIITLRIMFFHAKEIISQKKQNHNAKEETNVFDLSSNKISDVPFCPCLSHLWTLNWQKYICGSIPCMTRSHKHDKVINQILW